MIDCADDDCRDEETILVAEDEPSVQKIMSRVLGKAGYETLCASDGTEAIRLLESKRNSIVGAVLDAVMPQRNGEQVYAHIKQHQPQCGVVVCSGFANDSECLAFVEAEGLPFLAKPFDPTEFLLLLRETIDAKQGKRSGTG